MLRRDAAAMVRQLTSSHELPFAPTKRDLLVRSTPIIDAYRAIPLHGELLGRGLATASIVAFGVLALGWLAFHRAETRFAESV